MNIEKLPSMQIMEAIREENELYDPTPMNNHIKGVQNSKGFKGNKLDNNTLNDIQEHGNKETNNNN